MAKKKKYPNLKEEMRLWKKGFLVVAGIDEAGRGPLAGPVTAAAVMINSKFKARSTKKYLKIKNSKEFRILLSEVKDSKKLSSAKREKLYKIITKTPGIDWGIGVVSEKIIDKINIKNAAELAMEKAVKKLRPQPDFLIIDGNQLANRKLKAVSHQLIVKADEKVFSCAAASILAKVARDKIMEKYDKKYPGYGFKINKGYPTKYHLEMLRKHGICGIHRKSFAPVKVNSKA